MVLGGGAAAAGGVKKKRKTVPLARVPAPVGNAVVTALGLVPTMVPF
jgi:hypothetical protein